MALTQLRTKRRRRGMTLVEIIFVSAITLMITVPMTYTLIFVSKTHATAADQSLQRVRTDKIIDQMIMDIRNTSRGTYNSVGWTLLSGTGSTAPKMTLSLFDTVMGQRVTWTYTRKIVGGKVLYGKLSRQTTAYNGSGSPLIRTTNYPLQFADFTMTEIVQPDPPPAITTLYTAIRVRGRVLLDINVANTTWKEKDGDNNKDFRDDKIGAALFGRVDKNDDPKWQYIINVEPAFRNT